MAGRWRSWPWWVYTCTDDDYLDYCDDDGNACRWIAEELESWDETQDKEEKSHLWVDPLRPGEAKGNHHYSHHHCHDTQDQHTF